MSRLWKLQSAGRHRRKHKQDPDKTNQVFIFSVETLHCLKLTLVAQFKVKISLNERLGSLNFYKRNFYKSFHRKQLFASYR